MNWQRKEINLTVKVYDIYFDILKDSNTYRAILRFYQKVLQILDKD